jgi:hypothetical protein
MQTHHFKIHKLIYHVLLSYFWPEDNKEGYLLYVREIGWDGVDWIDMAQDRDQWRALVNTVLNLRVP